VPVRHRGARIARHGGRRGRQVQLVGRLNVHVKPGISRTGKSGRPCRLRCPDRSAEHGSRQHRGCEHHRSEAAVNRSQFAHEAWMLPPGKRPAVNETMTRQAPPSTKIMAFDDFMIAGSPACTRRPHPRRVVLNPQIRAFANDHAKARLDYCGSIIRRKSLLPQWESVKAWPVRAELVWYSSPRCPLLS
jgi:hypothetical protein